MTNKEVIEALYAAFAAGDIPAVTALMADDIHWSEAEGNKLADRSPYIGPQAVVEGVFQRLAEDFARSPLFSNTWTRSSWPRRSVVPNEAFTVGANHD